MGVVNVTPDSFSDGGEWFAADEAIRHGLAALGRGRRSRRRRRGVHPPGAERPEPAEELRRVLPGHRGAGRGQGARSASTPCGRDVARAAVDAGAILVNDVSGGQADAEHDHDRGGARRPVRVHALARALGRHAEPGRLRRRGGRGASPSSASQIERCRAGGIGGRSADHRPGHRASPRTPSTTGSCCGGSTSWRRSELPVLIGVSRKTFLGQLLGDRRPTAAGQGARRRLGGPHRPAGRPSRLGRAGPHRTSPSRRHRGGAATAAGRGASALTSPETSRLTGRRRVFGVG